MPRSGPALALAASPTGACQSQNILDPQPAHQRVDTSPKTNTAVESALSETSTSPRPPHAPALPTSRPTPALEHLGPLSQYPEIQPHLPEGWQQA